MSTETGRYIKCKLPFRFSGCGGHYIPDLVGMRPVFKQYDWYGRRAHEFELHYNKMPSPQARLKAVTPITGFVHHSKYSLMDVLSIGGFSIDTHTVKRYLKYVFEPGYLVSLIPYVHELLEQHTKGIQFRDERHFLSLDKQYWFSLFTSYQVAFNPTKGVYVVYEFKNMQRWNVMPFQKISQYTGERDVYKPFAPLQIHTLHATRYFVSVDYVYDVVANFIVEFHDIEPRLFEDICAKVGNYIRSGRHFLAVKWMKIRSNIINNDYNRTNPMYDHFSYFTTPVSVKYT